MVTHRTFFSLHAASFTVNLRSRGSENIALHLNARIKSGLLIRNSLLGQGWGHEELELCRFPFAPGQYFEVLHCLHCGLKWNSRNRIWNFVVLIHHADMHIILRTIPLPIYTVGRIRPPVSYIWPLIFTNEKGTRWSSFLHPFLSDNHPVPVAPV